MKKRVGLLSIVIICIFGMCLISCGNNDKENKKADKTKKELTEKDLKGEGRNLTQSGQAEEKKKRLGNILKKLFSLIKKANKNPRLQNDPKIKAEFEKLGKECKSLVKELTEGDIKKESEIYEEVAKKYAPEIYKELIESRKKTLIKRTATEIRNLKQALEMYELDTGKYPPSGNANMVSALLNGPNAPYMEFKKDKLKDGKYLDNWGRPYHYRENCSVTPKDLNDPNVAGHNDYSFDIWSNGPNGIDEKGEGDDINNWSR